MLSGMLNRFHVAAFDIVKTPKSAMLGLAIAAQPERIRSIKPSVASLPLLDVAIEPTEKKFSAKA
ncbi:MAG: hypothetical protein WBY93_16255 [Candidatus Binatus sp.]